METSDTVVVGAGIIGCATAFWLARAGLSVTVIERDRLAQHASSGPVSLLAPLDARDDVRARAGWSSLEALREIESELAEVSTLDPRIDDTGLLRLASERDCDAMRRRVVDASHQGCQWYDRADLEAWDSRLDRRWHGGIWSPGESQVDGARLARAFARGAEHYGARFEFGKPAVGLAMSDGCVAGVLTGSDELFATGEVVICTGNWTAEVAHWVGATVEYETVAGGAMKLEPSGLSLPGSVSAGGLQLISDLGELWIGDGLAGTLEMASDAEPAPNSTRDWTHVDGPADLIDAASHVIPRIADFTRGRTWVGSYARTADRMPLVGRVPNVEGLVLATGHGPHGVLLSALTAASIVELIVEGQVSDEAEPFAPDRFA